MRSRGRAEDPGKHSCMMADYNALGGRGGGAVMEEIAPELALWQSNIWMGFWIRGRIQKVICVHPD